MLAMPHDMVNFSKMPAIFDHFCLNLICISPHTECTPRYNTGCLVTTYFVQWQNQPAHLTRCLGIDALVIWKEVAKSRQVAQNISVYLEN